MHDSGRAGMTFMRSWFRNVDSSDSTLSRRDMNSDMFQHILVGHLKVLKATAPPGPRRGMSPRNLI